MPPIFRNPVIDDPTSNPAIPKFRIIHDPSLEQITPAVLPVSADAGNALSKRSDGLYVSATGEVSYEHTQSTPSAKWDIQHNLGFNPVQVIVFRDDGELVYTHIDYPNATDNLVSVTFAAPVSGTAYIKPL